MNKFTIKDFIQKSSPCPICNSWTTFSVKAVYGPALVKGIDHSLVNSTLKCNLFTGYSYQHYIDINIVTNKYCINNINGVSNFLSKNDLYIMSCCKTDRNDDGSLNHFFYIESSRFKFNMEKQYISPISAELGKIFLYENEFSVTLSSYYYDNDSSLTFIKNKGVTKTKSLPLIDILNVKTKEHFLNKIKTCMVFS